MPRLRKPKLTPEARQLLVESYVSLRRGDTTPGSRVAYRMTVRQLEALIRLSEALARRHLDDQVLPRYVRLAVRLLKTSIISVESSELDLSEFQEENNDGDDGGNGGNEDNASAQGNMSIRSSSLRKLMIEAITIVGPPEELRIWAPNLETLDISGDPYRKCMLMNVSSLTHASLGFYEPVEIHREDFSGDDFLGETLRQIFPSIQHVQMVRSLNWSIKVLEHMTNVDLVSPFLIMLLNIKEYDEEYEDVFEIFPKLKMLVLLDEDECQPSLKFDIESGLKLVP